MMARDSSIAFSPSRHQIDLVREYHIRLVGDGVTGKLKVRDVVLPDLPPADMDLPDDLNEASDGEEDIDDQEAFDSES